MGDFWISLRRIRFCNVPYPPGTCGLRYYRCKSDLLPDPTTMFPQRSTPRQATQQPQPNTQRPDQSGVRWYEKSGMPGLDTSTKPTPGNKNVVYKLSLNATEVCGLPPNTLVTVGIEDFIYWLRNKAGGQLVAQTGDQRAWKLPSRKRYQCNKKICMGEY